MSRRLYHIEAAADEAIRLNATFDYEITSKNIVAVIGCRGKTRKVFMSCNPKNKSGSDKIRRDVRKQITEMREGK